MRIAVISDIHVGHKAAIWPDPFYYEDEEGNPAEIKPHRWQKILLEYWTDFWGQPEVRDSEIVLNLAESIEGKNDKEFGKNLMTPDIDLQADAFEQLLLPRLKGRKEYAVVSGNKYHESGDTETERKIAQSFKDKLKIKSSFHYCMANRKWSRRIIQIAHCLTDAMQYKSTALDKESLFQDACEGGARKFDYHTDLIATGHCHTFFLNQNESRISFMAPCWKCWHPIRKMGAKRYALHQPSIGGLVIEIGSTISVKAFLYPLIHVYDALR